MFRSTPPWGRRPLGGLGVFVEFGFDPRLRGGGDSVLTISRRREASFDPRLRGGGDSNLMFCFIAPPWGRRLCCPSVEPSSSEFRSTPPWGRRLNHLSNNMASKAFRSTPPWGRRRRPVPLTSHSTGFDPRLRGGGDNGGMDEFNRAYMFRSTPPWGRRRDRDYANTVLGAVSIHASVGEATRARDHGPDVLTVSIHASVGEATGFPLIV